MVALCRLVPPQHFLPERQRLLEAIEQAVAQQMRQGSFRALDPTFVTHWVNAQIEWVITRCLVERAGDYRGVSAAVDGCSLSEPSSSPPACTAHESTVSSLCGNTRSGNMRKGDHLCQ